MAVDRARRVEGHGGDQPRPTTEELAIQDSHDDDRDRPLVPYLGTMAAYGTLVSGLAMLVARRDALPDRIETRDLVLGGIATHKLSRLVAKDAVTRPVRAPFTEYDGPAEASEVHEHPRGHGAQHAVGELISCPFCTSQWIATAVTFGYALAPRATRFAASLFATVTLSDALQYALTRARQST